VDDLQHALTLEGGQGGATNPLLLNNLGRIFCTPTCGGRPLPRAIQGQIALYAYLKYMHHDCRTQLFHLSSFCHEKYHISWGIDV
jgi:hypothetical protein